jgi:hypothetical protein
VRLLRRRGEKVAQVEGICSVDGQIASSADLMFAFADDRVD